MGAHLPLLGLDPVGGEPLMFETCGQSNDITAHWLVPNYTAW